MNMIVHEFKFVVNKAVVIAWKISILHSYTINIFSWCHHIFLFWEKIRLESWNNQFWNKGRRDRLPNINLLIVVFLSFTSNLDQSRIGHVFYNCKCESPCNLSSAVLCFYSVTVELQTRLFFNFESRRDLSKHIVLLPWLYHSYLGFLTFCLT